MTSIGFVTWGNLIPPLSHFCLSVRNNSFIWKHHLRVNAVWHGTTFNLLNWGCYKCFRLYPTGSKIGILLATLHLPQHQEDVSLLNLTHINQTTLSHHVLAQEVALGNKRGRFQLQQFPSFEWLLPNLLCSFQVWSSEISSISFKEEWMPNHRKKGPWITCYLLAREFGSKKQWSVFVL